MPRQLLLLHYIIFLNNYNCCRSCNWLLHCGNRCLSCRRFCCVSILRLYPIAGQQHSQSVCCLRIVNEVKWANYVPFMLLIGRRCGILFKPLECGLSGDSIKVIISNKWLCYGRGTARRACQLKFFNYKTSHLKTRVPGLSCGIICVILRLAVFVQYRSVTDTHKQTDGRTDTRRRHESRLA